MTSPLWVTAAAFFAGCCWVVWTAAASYAVLAADRVWRRNRCQRTGLVYAAELDEDLAILRARRRFRGG